MSTALKIIEQAFTWIEVLAAETPLQASELKDGIDFLNDRLALWDAENILKGATPVMNASDIVTIPRYAEMAVKTQLALDLAGPYGKQPSSSLAQAALDSKRSMLNASIGTIRVELPSTLPTGSGNQWQNYLRDEQFFPENSKTNF